MTRFRFQRRVTTISYVWFEAATEQEAWAKALDGAEPVAISDEHLLNKPIFRRQPGGDEYDL